MASNKDILSSNVELLKNKQSPKRRSAAKRLRKLGDPAAGSALLDALRTEVQDPRTWETQYQMIMALGECGHREALPLLRELASTKFEATMIYVALGDAIARLSRESASDSRAILECARSGNDMLADGAFRAMAMLRMVPDDATIGTLIDLVSQRPLANGLLFWIVAAAPGWKGPKVEAFLKTCFRNSRDDVRRAAVEAVAGRYRKWNPL